MTRTSIASLSAALLALPACHKAEPPSDAPAAAASSTVSAAPAQSAYHEDTFDVSLEPIGPLAAGKQGAIAVRLSAKGGYHCNDKYPYKFKVGRADGVKFSTQVFTTDALKLSESSATMQLDLTPESKGQKSVSGTFAFSLCSAERCLVEKRDLSATLAVD